jgi:Fe-S-cluster-containing dehydrogenase component
MNKTKGITRRRMLKTAAGAGIAAFLAGCSPEEREVYFRKRFRELTPDEIQAVLAREEKTYTARFGKPVLVHLSRCIGCRRCVYACVDENNQSREPQIHWIKVLRMKKEDGVDIMEADAYYDPPTVPEDDYFYMPVACQQCRKPPCVRVCPVKATWQEPDGIVVIDYNWCIGCRCCMAACPYGARHFNWNEPHVPKDKINTNTHYLGNRPRPRGVVEKCSFCIQRVRKDKGRYPACLEACPVGARKFGNLLDPASEIRYLLREKRVFIFKEELATKPKFYYFYAT